MVNIYIYTLGSSRCFLLNICILQLAVIELKRFESTTFKARRQESIFDAYDTEINTVGSKFLGKYTITGPLLGVAPTPMFLLRII